MGRRGPPPKPTRLKILAGNPGKRPLNDAEPVPAPGRPSCPAWVSKEGRAEWRRVTRELEALGLLARIDQATLACYCQSVAEVRIATVTEGDLDRQLKTAVAFAEPVMLFLIAALIGAIFISMVLPIFTLQDYIK